MKTNKLLWSIIYLLFFLSTSYCMAQEDLTKKNVKIPQTTPQTPKKPKIKAPENEGTLSTLTNNYVVEYDFKTGLYTHNTVKPKVHYPIVYRIKNINRFAYNIEVKSKDSILASSFSLDNLSKDVFVTPKKEEALTGSTGEATTPKPVLEVNSNDIKDIEKKELNDKKNIVEVLNSTLQILDMDKRIAEETGKLNLILDSINKNAKSLEFYNTDMEEITSKIALIHADQKTLELINSRSDEENKKLENSKIAEKLLTNQKKILKKRDDLNTNLNTVKWTKDDLKISDEALQTFIKDNEKLSILFSQFRQTFREVNKINNCYDKLYELISYHQLDSLKASEKLKDFKKEQDKFDDYKSQIEILKSNYYDIQIQYEIVKRNYKLNELLSEGGQTKLYGQADDLMNRSKRMYEKINLTETQKKLNLIPMIIESLKNVNTFEWISAPVQPSGDVVSFDVDIKAKNKTGEKIIDERKFRQQEFTRGGTRIDFGLGLAASYFNNTPIYELQVKKVNNLSQISIQQKSDDLFVPSLVGLVTMSRRSSTYTCLGGSAGLGIDVVNGRIQLSNFFAGPSITFGRYERLTFTSGASFRNVQQLKSGYKTDSIVTETSDDIDNYLTDKYKIGFFASLTFVLTKGVKENLKKIPSYR